MPYYQNHVFVCTNLRTDGRQSCNQFQAQEMRDYMKKRTKELGIAGAGDVRINSAGCLNRGNQVERLMVDSQSPC